MYKQFGEEKIHISINADHSVSLSATIYAYAASGNIESVELTEYSLLYIVSGTLGVLLIKKKIAQLIQKGYKVLTRSEKALWTVYEYQLSAYFTGQEGENIEDGENNLEIVMCILENGKFEKASELVCAFDLDRNCVLTVSSCTNRVRAEISETATGQTQVSLNMVRMSLTAVSRCMKQLHLYEELSRLWLKIMKMYGDMDTIKH